MPDEDFKTCPYCQEKIRKSAIKCRFCGEWLESLPESPGPAPETPTAPQSPDIKAPEIQSEVSLLTPERTQSVHESPPTPCSVSEETKVWRYKFAKDNGRENESISFKELIDFATRNDPRLENMLVRKDGWAEYKRAREVPEIKEAALSWPRGYSFAIAYAYLLIFAAIRALITKDSWIIEYGKSLAPSFVRANVWTLQGALWISLAYYIFRR